MFKKVGITLFVVVMMLHTVFWLANKAVAAPLDVCPSGCTYTTIQAAVNNAAPFDTVNVSAGTYPENVVINKSLTVQGADATSTIVDGTDSESVFVIDGSVTVTLTNMTITNGNAANSLPTSWGGGIAIEQGDVTLDNVIVSNNFASMGGGISSSGGKLTVLNSQIMNNIAGDMTTARGGGIEVSESNASAQVVIINSTIVNNTASSFSGGVAIGGGIASSASSLRIENSTINGNHSSSGVSSGSAGGIFINGDSDTITKTAVIQNSTISGNSTVFSGGGLYVTNSAVVTLTNNTIVSNTAALLAGGISSFNSSTVNLKNTLTAQNSPSDCGKSGGFILSNDHNLDSDDSCGLTEANDLSATLPLIGPLQDNGGSTETHALLENSPAINAGAGAGCPAKDQRGVIRPQGPACDIGAYEFEEESFFTEFIYLPMIVKE
jgi:hypothetical protein